MNWAQHFVDWINDWDIFHDAPKHLRPLISEWHSLTVNQTETELLKCDRTLLQARQDRMDVLKRTAVARARPVPSAPSSLLKAPVRNTWTLYSCPASPPYTILLINMLVSACE